MTAPTIIYHGGCPDGWGAAYWLNQYLRGWHSDEVELVGAAHRDDAPDVSGRVVFMVDFVYDDLSSVVEVAEQASSLLILDHHATALHTLRDGGGHDIILYEDIERYLNDPVPERANAVIDQNHSGIGLAARFVEEATGLAPPEWFAHIEDRDLWRFDLDDTANVCAAVMSRPYTVEAWNVLEQMSVDDLAVEGEAIERYRQQLIDSAVERARPVMVAGFGLVSAVDCPYQIGSDVAGLLAEQSPNWVGGYYLTLADGSVKWGLRSRPDGPDVAKIAEGFGGGGHTHAAGFTISA